MYKFLIPLFALALLIGCTPQTPMPTPSTGSVPTGFDGVILSGKHVVTVKTNYGDIVLELDADMAPKTVTNFVALAKSGFYNGLTFHRVIPRFMLQGGDPAGDGTGGASVFGESFEDEINAQSLGLSAKEIADLERDGYSYDSSLRSLPLTRGVIAMANRGPDTNGSQFFIVQGEATPWLNGRHTVFGRVTQGMDVVDEIANVQRDENDRPVKPVTFTVEVK